MNLQQAAQPRSSTNGFARRRVEKDNCRMDNRLQPGKSNPSRLTSITSGSKGEGSESPSLDRLVYLTTCLIGHHVEVQVKNGSVYSGIFHAKNADKEFGIVLKMALSTEDVSFRGQKTSSDSVGRDPSRTLIIPAHELVQIVAKDVPITGDGLSNEMQGEKQRDIMLDSSISQSRHVEVERELEPWMPDEDDLECPELENIFDSPWTGSWDQFKVNETLFGVKSSFNEELYTTKLEKGPRMRELEEEAMRIAKEIEVEETYDLHLAEERGVFPRGNLDIDEETKYSSVYRGVDDSGYEDEDILLNSRDKETFGDYAGPAFGRSFADVTSGKNGKSFGGSRMSFKSSLKDEIQPAQFNANQELYHSDSLASNHSSTIRGFEDDSKVQENHINEREGNAIFKDSIRTQTLSAELQTGKTDDLQSLWDAKTAGSDKAGVSSMAATYSHVATKVEEKTSSSEHSEDRSRKGLAATYPENSRGQLGSSSSSTRECGAATSLPSAPVLSPTSSVGSRSSEKSTLNPNAKEFKLNPNAKSFIPSQTPVRPLSPVPDGSFYFPTTMHTVPHMHGMPVGIGVGPSLAGPQPVLFDPQAAAMQSPHAYFPANGPQHMILGHPRQLMYMPGYSTEMPYKGREF